MYPLIDVLLTLPLPLVPIVTLYAKTYIAALRKESDKDLVNDRINRTKVFRVMRFCDSHDHVERCKLFLIFYTIIMQAKELFDD